MREILVPDGRPIGDPGRSRTGTVRILPGGVEAAEEVFARFEEIGEVEETVGYPGRFVGLGAGRGSVFAGLR